CATRDQPRLGESHRADDAPRVLPHRRAIQLRTAVAPSTAVGAASLASSPGGFGRSLGPTERPNLAAATAAAEELVAPVGLQAGDVNSLGQVQRFEDGAGRGIDAAQVTLVAFPGAMPQLLVDPCHARDEALRLEGAQHRSGLWIDLV